MTSPNVGKITVSAVVDSSAVKAQLEKQMSGLTRDMQKNLLPQMEKLNKLVEDTNKKLGQLDKKPFEEIRKEAEKVADEHRKIARALDSEEDAQLRVEKATERQRKAQVAFNKELKKTNDESKISEDIKNRLALATKDVEAAERKLGITQQRVADEHVAAYESVIAASKKSVEEQIRDAKRLTAETEREARKRVASEAKAEKERKQHARAVRGGILGPVDVVGEIARAFGGMGRLSTPAFNTVVLGALTAAGAVASLSKAVFLLPAAFSAAAAGVGVLAIGLSGFSDTMKHLMDGDLEKFSVALRNLSPNAQQAALGIQKLLPRFHDLKIAVQDALFANAEPIMTALTDRFLPSFQGFATQIATAMNQAFTGVADVLMQPQTLTQVQSIFTNIARSFEVAGPALAQFTQAFVTITQAGSEFLPGLAEKFTEMATAFSKFIEEKNASGELGDWIERGLNTAGQLVDIAWDLGRAFMSLAPVAEQILPHLLSTFEFIADALEAFPALIFAIPAAFIGWSAIGGVWSLFKNLTLIITALQITMPAAAATGAAGVSASMATAATATATVGTAARTAAGVMATAFGGLVAAGGAIALLLAGLAEVVALFRAIVDPNVQAQMERVNDEVRRNTGGASTRGGMGRGRAPGMSDRQREQFEANPPPVPIRPAPSAPSGGREPGWGGLPLSEQDRWKQMFPNIPFPEPANIPLPPLPVDDDKKSEKDYLSGRARGPLTEMSDANKKMLDRMVKDIKKTPMPGTEIGPFGTPIKPRNRGYEMAAAVISSLGGDPEVFIGENPIKMAEENWKDFLDRVADATRDQLEPLLQQPRYDPMTHPGLYTPNGQPMSANWDALAKFESSGKWNANTGNGYFGGLQFTKETWMANKPSGAPDNPWEATREQQIAAAENVLKTQGKGAWPAAAAAHPEWFQPQPTMGLPGGGPKGSKSGLQPAAANLWDVIATQFPQIAEIGGVRKDSLPYHPSGRALDIMIPGTGGLNDPTPPGARALGDSIYQFLMTNASQLGIDTGGTLWQQKDHYNHIHAQLIDGIQQFTDAGLTAGGLGPGVGPSSSLSAGGVTQVYVTNWPGSAQGSQGQEMFNMVRKNLIDPLVHAGAQTAGGVAGGAASSALGAILPQARHGPPADLNQLLQERNPLALAQMLGIQVPDFGVQGGGAGAQNLMTGDGPAFTASGQIFSDTAALLDRSFSTQEAANQARHEQILSVMNQVADRLGTNLLEPVVSSGVTSGIEGLSSAALDQLGTVLGTQIGNVSAPIIAAAVRDAIPPPAVATPDVGAGLGTGPAPGPAVVRDEGGPLPTGFTAVNTSGAMEHVLSPSDTALLYSGWKLQPQQQHFATTSGVMGNETVGAEFFGVSQVPGINIIVNLMVRVLLAILGIQIEVRDTLDEMSDGFREFRGEFEAFDAMGRMMNDTSALIERTSTSEQAAADERIRILKIVIQELIKFIIEKIVVPVGKAVGNAAVSAGAGAAGAAINSQAPGVGNIVSSVISSAGSATIDIVADIGAEFAVSLTEVLIDVIGDTFQSAFPDLANAIFGGGAAAGVADPIVSNIVDPILGAFGGLMALFGGLSFDTGLFDEGGIARGTGLMPKATISPERVLSPHQTRSFDRLVAAVEAGQFGSNRTTTIHAPFTVSGGERGAREARDRLLELMN